MAGAEETVVNTYCDKDDIMTLVPDLGHYFKTHFQGSVQEAENYIARCRRIAFDFINNQLESMELETHALTNEKRWIEANYAVYMILRGTLRGERAEQNTWLKSFKEESESLMADLIRKAT